MAKQKKCECEAGAPMWMVTFGDLMSLLLTFFILLLSFATMDKPREYQEAIISIKGAFGIMPRELTAVQINPMPVRMRRPNKKVEDVARRIQRSLQVVGMQKDIEMKYDDAGGLKITLPGQILFATGETQLQPSAYPLLSNIGALLAELPETSFEVHGHSDSSPVASDGPFRDNHDLSYARADSVARFLDRNTGLTIGQFAITGRGSGHPVATNTTPEGRSANRRVEIYVRGIMGNVQVKQLQDRIRELTTQP